MNNIKILMFLLDNKEEQFTINQISKALDMNYRIAHEKTKSLEQEGLLQTRKVGNALLCSLTNKFNEKVFSAEYKRRERLLKKNDFRTIVKRFREANQNYILLLFGSYAKNKATKHSDIDILAITEKEMEIKEISELIPKNIHLTTASYKSFTNMIQSKKMSVGSEAVKNNIVLIGIEDYYRLMKNAQ